MAELQEVAHLSDNRETGGYQFATKTVHNTAINRYLLNGILDLSHTKHPNERQYFSFFYLQGTDIPFVSIILPILGIKALR